MYKKIKKAVLSVLLILTLTDFARISSADSLESALLVSAMSIGYEDGQYRTSFIYIDYSPDKNGQSEYRLFTVSAPTIGECIENAKRNSRENIFFGQTDAVFLEEEIIKDRVLFRSVTDFLERDPYMGYSIYIFGVKGEINAFDEMIEKKDENITAFLDNIIVKDPLSELICARLVDAVSPYGCVIPAIHTKSSAKVLSLYTINYGTLTGEFEEKYFTAYSVMSGKDGEYYFSAPLGEFYTDRSEPEFSFDGSTLTVTLSGSFSSFSLNGYTSLQGKMINKAEDMFNEAVKAECGEFIKAMKEKNSDPLLINEYLHRFHTDYYASLTQKDISAIEEIPIKIEAEYTFRGNGIMY